MVACILPYDPNWFKLTMELTRANKARLDRLIADAKENQEEEEVEEPDSQ